MNRSGKPTRKSMRYPLEVPVSFSWTDENGIEQKGEGSSRDVSETGTYVFASGCPPTGADVELRLVVAARDAPRVLNMEFEGRVLRVERLAAAQARCGFAVLSRVAILRDLDSATDRT